MGQRFLGVLLIWTFSQTTLAMVFSEHPHSRARLVSAHDGVAPTGTTYLALHILLDKDWHSYWRNPGDSGAAPIFDFQVPAGVRVSEALYPRPHRMAAPPLMTFGYENEVMYLFQVFLDPGYQGDVTIALEAEWLVCKVECIPALGSFKLTLPVTDTPRPTEYEPLMAEYKGQLPEPFAQTGLELEARMGDRSGTVELRLDHLKGGAAKLVDFFPLDTKLDNKTPERLERKEREGLVLKASPEFTRDDSIVGLLVFEDGGIKRSTDIDLPIATGPPVTSQPPGSLAKILLFAFLGGVLLNFMPCVFPVIAIKLLGILQHARGHRSTLRLQCLAYVCGVVVSFMVLGGLLVALRVAGVTLGWGFQLQSPEFLVALSFLFVLMAFSFLGLFEIQITIGRTGSRMMAKDGLAGQFMTGVLSTVVASPCTAPFMGFAMGVAISQSAAVIMVTFAALGLGLGLPYIAFMVSPGLLSVLPKPGAWMESLRQFMAFPLLATCLWLLWVLGQVAGHGAVIVALGGLLLVGLGLWIYRRFQKAAPAALLAATALVTSVYVVRQQPGMDEGGPGPKAQAAGGIAWGAFAPEALAAAQREGKAVFVDFTADWCITCKVNERVTFYEKEVQEFVVRHDIVMLKADWTKRDESITKVLGEYGRIGVPLYLFWAPGASRAAVLPEVLTPGIFMGEVQEHLDRW